jgi:hypothetical protein
VKWFSCKYLIWIIPRVRRLIDKPGKKRCFFKTDSTYVVLGKNPEKIREKKLFETQKYWTKMHLVNVFWQNFQLSNVKNVRK